MTRYRMEDAELRRDQRDSLVQQYGPSITVPPPAPIEAAMFYPASTRTLLIEINDVLTWCNLP